MESIVSLTEYVKTPAVALSTEERDRLLDPSLGMNLSPSRGLQDCYDLTPSLVGVIDLGGRLVSIRPRFGILNALFLISYALDPSKWASQQFNLEEDTTFVEALALIFGRHLRQAMAHGVLNGYYFEEEALKAVRGRIRLGDQISRRFGRMPPIEVEFDEFSEDTLENRLIRAALLRLRHTPLRFASVRRMLGDIESLLANVTVVKFAPNRLPEVNYTRLNQHYRTSVEVARFILRGASVEFRAGHATHAAFLVDMAVVFEHFLVAAVREALRVGSRQLVHGGSGRSIWLDVERQIPLKPDISIWQGSNCQLVADVKYKEANGGARPDDIYQLLAYAVATDVSHGFIVHASGASAAHRTRYGAKYLEVRSLDLTVSPVEILCQVSTLAERLAYVAGNRQEATA